jgi:hypothetical protein
LTGGNNIVKSLLHSGGKNIVQHLYMKICSSFRGESPLFWWPKVEEKANDSNVNIAASTLNNSMICKAM